MKVRGFAEPGQLIVGKSCFYDFLLTTGCVKFTFHVRSLRSQEEQVWGLPGGLDVSIWCMPGAMHVGFLPGVLGQAFIGRWN